MTTALDKDKLARDGDRLAAEEAQSAEQVQGTDGPPDRPLAGGPVSHPEEAGLQLTPGFARMRTDWNSADWRVVQDMHQAVNAIIQDRFSDLLDIMLNIYVSVREMEIDEKSGLIKYGEDGMPVYKKTPTGAVIEDWTRLTIREQESALFSITAGLLRWEQVAEEMRAEALLAKAQFEEGFSHGYVEIKDPKATIDDRTARARIRAAELRYRSVYLSYLSRSADALVRSMERMGQRLKDVRTSP